MAARRLIGIALLVALGGGLAGCGGSRGGAPAVEIRGTNPQGPVPRLAPGATPTAQNGIITYDGYQAAVAQGGDTVSSLAARVGIAASELGAYNGLSPTHPLRAGDELVLPSRPGGYGDVSSNSGPAAVGVGAPVAVARAPVAETAPLAPLRPAVPAAAEPAPTGDLAALPPDPAAGPQTPSDAAPPPPARATASTWSPDLAAAAIERATGIDANGNLAAPPSAVAPLPADQRGQPTLPSPDLGQYQTPAPVARPGAQAEAARTQAAIADATATAALSTTAPPAARGPKLIRPVEGPIAIGYNKGAGPTRNDGVDFAAPAGSPVVAAEDGEVALVSQSLGGLGTIVLVRHANELLTVYGRIEGVNVVKGDLVQRGQQIGVVSDAGAPAEPRMHFEVRRGAESLDPTAFF